MKVFTYLALLGGAAAIRLMSHQTSQALIQPTPMRHLLVELNKSEDWPELTKEQMKEIEDWVKSEIGDGTGTITKEEATHALQAFADSHGFEITEEMWEEAEMAFDHVDANGDGELDLKEIMDVVDEHHGDGSGSDSDGEGHGKKDKKGKKGGKKGHKDIQMKRVLAQLSKSEDWPELTKEQMKEIEDWVKSEIGDGTGTITKEEATHALQAFADSHGFEITEEMWEEAEMAFDHVDANGDGELDLKEIMDVVDEHHGDGSGSDSEGSDGEGHGKKGKKGGKKGHKDIQMKRVLAQLSKSEDWPELTKEQMKEIEDWVKSEIGDGTGTITKDEAAAALQAFADSHGFEITPEMWQEAEMAFDHVDANGDGELDLNEIMKVVEEHEGGDHKGGKGKKGKKDKHDKKDIQMKKVLAQLSQSEDWPELNDEQMKEIEDWVRSEIGDGTGTITKDEAAAALQAFADKHGFEVTEEMWTEAEMAFDYVDTNGDGELDLNEIMKVVEEHEGGDKKGGKGKKGKGKKGKGKKGKGKKGKGKKGDKPEKSGEESD